MDRTGETDPLCLIDNLKDQPFCRSMEVSTVLIFIVMCAFMYQILYVWLQSYKYTVSDRRIQIMIACVIYCSGVIFYNITQGKWKAGIEIILAYFHF